VLLYVKRWLVAPLQHPVGTLSERVRGTPQGSAVSPVPANLLMHYALDVWLSREHPDVVFERYADDVVVRCASHARATQVLAAIAEPMNGLGLTLNQAKTQVVYCKGTNRRQNHPTVSFTFLGYTFRPRAARDRHGATFCAFLPAISKQALKKISTQVRRWRLHRKIFHTFWRACPPDQPGRRGMDAVLRQVLLLRAVSAPGAHQRLPGALDPQQVPPV
jgi:hypothetical protein